MQAIVDTARARGLHALIGGLSADNEASLKLHENFGFVEVARMPQVGRKFGNWLDLVYVQLTLDERALPGDPLPTE
jgi:phosphinothricin acetyltransferase